MYNQLTLVGRWTKDTELTYANNGTEILKASLAVSDDYNKEHTDFFEVIAFKATAANTNRFTSKGSKVLIHGKLQQQRWEKDGQKRSKVVVIANRIVFLDSKSEKTTQNNTPKQETRENLEPQFTSEDLPF